VVIHYVRLFVGGCLALRGHDGRITSASFSPDGNRVITTAEDGTVRVWNAINGQQVRPPVICQSRTGDRIHAVFNSTSDRFVVRDNISMVLHVVQPAENVDEQFPVYRTRHVATSTSAGNVALYSRRSSNVSIVSGSTFRLICRLSVPTGVTDVVLHPKQRRALVTSGADMILFDTETGDRLAELQGHRFSVTKTCFAGRNDTVCSVSADGTMRLWHLRSGRERNTLIPPNTERTTNVDVLSPVQCPNEKLVATAS
jgi:WD40 repeat protein